MSIHLGIIADWNSSFQSSKTLYSNEILRPIDAWMDGRKDRYVIEGR
jgi:hypothetical protein